jgi:hypothetical protein
VGFSGHIGVKHQSRPDLRLEGGGGRQCKTCAHERRTRLHELQAAGEGDGRMSLSRRCLYYLVPPATGARDGHRMHRRRDGGARSHDSLGEGGTGRDMWWVHGMIE